MSREIITIDVESDDEKVYNSFDIAVSRENFLTKVKTCSRRQSQGQNAAEDSQETALIVREFNESEYEPKTFTVHHNDRFICFYCGKNYSMSHIFNHMTKECEDNKNISLSVRHKYKEQGRASSRKSQAKVDMKTNYLRYSDQAFKKKGTLVKRDVWLGRFLNLLSNQHPFYLPLEVEKQFLPWESEAVRVMKGFSKYFNR